MSRFNSPLRRAFAVAALAALAGGCRPAGAAPHAPPEADVLVLYHHAGRSTRLPAGALPAGEAERVFRELLAGTADASQMLVYDALIERQRRSETALELVLPAPDSFAAGTFGRVRADRLFVPLTGPHTQAGDALEVFAGDGGYARGPFLNPHGRAVVADLLARAQRESEGR